MTPFATLRALARRLLPPSRPPVVAHPIPCSTCRGVGSYLTLDYEVRTCAVCRRSPGVEGWSFHRPGVVLGSLSAAAIGAEGAERLALHLCRMPDDEAMARIVAEAAGRRP